MGTQIKQTSTIRWTDIYTKKMADTAADITGQSINSVIMSAVRYYGEKLLTERKKAIEEFGPVILSPDEFNKLSEAIKNPPAPADELVKAVKRYRKAAVTHLDY